MFIEQSSSKMRTKRVIVRANSSCLCFSPVPIYKQVTSHPRKKQQQIKFRAHLAIELLLFLWRFENSQAH